MGSVGRDTSTRKKPCSSRLPPASSSKRAVDPRCFNSRADRRAIKLGSGRGAPGGGLGRRKVGTGLKVSAGAGRAAPMPAAPALPNGGRCCRHLSGHGCPARSCACVRTPGGSLACARHRPDEGLGPVRCGAEILMRWRPRTILPPRLQEWLLRRFMKPSGPQTECSWEAPPSLSSPR